jgi:WD40 repeat protein
MNRSILFRCGRKGLDFWRQSIVLLIVCLVGIPAWTAETPVKSALAVAELKRESPVDFEREILPIFRNNCLACHNTTKAKASLNLETPKLILKGGDNGPGVQAGRAAESLIFKAAAHLDPELIMPPKDNKANASNLSPEQLALLKLWIEQGAKGEVHTSTTVHWLENPPVLDPVLALDITADGQFAACSRGGRVDIYHVPSGHRVARLADSKLVGTAGGLTNMAHRDLVNAVAFNPAGTLLATAGYREVKIWRRFRNVEQAAVTNGQGLWVVSSDRKWLASVLPDYSIRLVALENDTIAGVLSGHTNKIRALAFSPDNKHLASVSDDRTFRIWNVDEPASTKAVDVTAELHAVAWLNGGTEVATAGEDGIIRINSATNLTTLREWKGHTGAVHVLTAFPNGKGLLSGGADGLARVWDPAEGTVRRYLTQSVVIAAAAISPDGRRVALAGTNELVKLWDAEEGRLLAELKGDRYANERVQEHERDLIVVKSDVAFHKKSLETSEADMKKAGDRIAKATETNNVTEKIFLEKEKAFKSASEAKVAAEKSLQDLVANIQRITESYEKADKAAKEATARATSSAAKATEAQLAADRALLSKADAEKIAADTASVANRTKAAVANADAAKDTARRIAEESAAVAERSRGFADAVSADAEMKLKLGNEARTMAEKAIEEVATLAFAAGRLKPQYDQTLAEAPEKRKQATNQVETTTKAMTEAEKEFKRAETRKSVTNHELELATAAGQKTSNVLSTARTTLNSAEDSQKQVETGLEQARRTARAAELPALALDFSPDGRTLATLSSDFRLHTWSGESGVPFDVLPQDGALTVQTSAPPSGVSFADNGHVLATRTAGRISLWNLNPGWTLERTIGGAEPDSPFADRVNAVRFSPDGKVLAAGGGEPTRSGEINFFNVEDGKLVRQLTDVHSDAVLSLDFSPDGRHLASSSADRFVKVLDLATGKVVKTFEGHTSYVLSVAWKRDSRTLASAGADKVIKVWDFVTGDRRKNIEGADKDVTGIAYVGVTDQLVASSGDSQVRLLKENGEKVRSFEGATDFMNTAATTPDGRVVVAGGQDGQLHVWNGTDGKKMLSFGPEK